MSSNNSLRDIAAISAIAVAILMFSVNPYHAAILTLVTIAAPAIVIALAVLIYDHKPWKWRIFQRKKVESETPVRLPETPVRLSSENVRNLADELRHKMLRLADTGPTLSSRSDYDEKNLKLARLNDLLGQVAKQRQSTELVQELVTAIEAAQNTYDDVRSQDRDRESNRDILTAELERRIGRMTSIAELIVQDTERSTPR